MRVKTMRVNLYNIGQRSSLPAPDDFALALGLKFAIVLDSRLGLSDLCLGQGLEISLQTFP
ncbi:MAG: hypothetical protein NW224_28370 [Leptolyngbyaceae cyanobacterium bins.302]|nr:hypothetical protein [Leptolyngbyaceae cyanobacterium bins.302]